MHVGPTPRASASKPGPTEVPMATKKRRAAAVSAGRAVAVVRVSTNAQVETGASLDAQRAAVEGYAMAMGLELVEVIEDPGVSGSVPLAQRPGGRRVLDLIERGDVGAVIALKLDRLFRDAADAMVVTRDWDARGVALHLLDLRVDTSTPIGRVFLGLIASLAEWERKTIAERTSAALQHLAAQGVMLGGEPLGRRRSAERDSNGRLLVEDAPDEIATVDRILELRAQGATLRAIAATLDAEAHPRKLGGARWSPSVVRAVIERARSQRARLEAA